MRRPLTLCGTVFLLSTLVTMRFSNGALLCFALLFIALCLGGVLLCRKIRTILPALLFAAAAFAFLWHLGYDTVMLRPIYALAGNEYSAAMRITEVVPGFGDSVDIVAKVLVLNGKAAPAGLRVQIRGVSPVGVGDEVALKLEFYAMGNNSSAVYQKGRGFYVGALAKSEFEIKGFAPDFFDGMRRLQYAAGQNITEKLPQRLGGIAAAMAVGDKRSLPREAVLAYRTAGLSHLLVVSGLHMAAVSGALYSLCRAIFKRKRKMAAVVAMLAVFGFMALTGFTLSVVRSGIMCLLMLCAPLFGRKADPYTSLGLAALVLCLQNPYAAADVGLLLSFSATLGALLSGQAANAMRARWNEMPAGKPQVFLRRAALLLLTPVCATAATLPVLIYAGFGASVWSIPANVIAVPLLSIIIPSAFLMALPSGIAVLNAIAQVGAIVCGALLAFLEKLTEFCAVLPGSSIVISGTFAFVAVGAVYFLVFMAVKTNKKKIYLPAAGMVFLSAIALHATLSAGLVSVVLAGGVDSPSVVVCKNGQAVVLYRGRQTAVAVQQALLAQNVQECVLLIDLRKTAEGTEYISLFAPQQVLVVQDDFLSNTTLAPMAGVEVYLKKQGEGAAAVIDIEGYKIGLVTGTFNLAPYAPLDVLVAGSGRVTDGIYSTIIVGSGLPIWADETAKVFQNGGNAQIVVRPKKSVVFREVRDGFFDE